MSGSLYSSLHWRSARARALARDSRRCTVSRLLGGTCSPGPLHVHHIVPVSEGGDAYELENLATTCARHHPMWESLRRRLVGRLAGVDGPPRCRHRHRSAEARAICDARLAREWERERRVAA